MMLNHTHIEIDQVQHGINMDNSPTPISLVNPPLYIYKHIHHYYDYY